MTAFAVGTVEVLLREAALLGALCPAQSFAAVAVLVVRVLLVVRALVLVEAAPRFLFER